MFTGLVRTVGKVVEALPFGAGKRFKITIGSLAENAEIGQSIAVNGVCLTVTELQDTIAAFDAVSETVSRSNLGALKAGSEVNLEPALKAGDALDGHIMLGHVDEVAPVIAIENDSDDSRRVTIQLSKNIRHLVAEKGSIAISGISLTVASATDDAFSVAVIPHTWENTTLRSLAQGDLVNLEVDVVARYAARIMQFQGSAEKSSITVDFLRENGFA